MRQVFRLLITGARHMVASWDIGEVAVYWNSRCPRPRHLLLLLKILWCCGCHHRSEAIDIVLCFNPRRDIHANSLVLLLVLLLFRFLFLTSFFLFLLPSLWFLLLLLLHSPPYPPSPSPPFPSLFFVKAIPSRKHLKYRPGRGLYGFNFLTCVIPADVLITRQTLVHVSWLFVDAVRSVMEVIPIPLLARSQGF